ncbi:hypothetical protein [Streptomyces lincolnensis]|uniref:hypothetical protein n=1 Tax=Streptomyces lincolnensis TaxID=1915 RepID=UPI0037D73558
MPLPQETYEEFSDRMLGFAEASVGASVGTEEDLRETRNVVAALHAAHAAELWETGVIYQAVGVVPVPEGERDEFRLSRCTLLLSVRDLPAADDPEVRVAGVAEVLAAADDGGEVLVVDLPAGPGVVHLAAQRMVWRTDPETDAGTGTEVERYSLRLEVWIPLPGTAKVLLLCLTTTHVQDLPTYQDILAEIAESVRVGEEESAARPAGPEAELAASTTRSSLDAF